MKKQATFTIEKETLTQLANLAEKLDITKSKIVNDLLVELLKETDNNKVENLLRKAIQELQS